VDAVVVKVANIGLYNCPHLGCLKVVTQTGAGTCILVLVVVVVVVVVVSSSKKYTSTGQHCVMLSKW